MLFYLVEVFCQSCAVSKSRKSIAQLTNIRPDHANLEPGGSLIEIDSNELKADGEIIIKPRKRVPFDGIIIDGSSEQNPVSLTGEPLPPIPLVEGDEVVSGCINLLGFLCARVFRTYRESIVARILDLIESAVAKKANIDNLITTFARYYTPIVVDIAAAIAVFPTIIFGEPFTGLGLPCPLLLAVSCPCTLVISVSSSFCGGIGGASRNSLLNQRKNYLEALVREETVVFDKTGTFTTGTFCIEDIRPENGITRDQFFEYAAVVESMSTTPACPLHLRGHTENQPFVTVF
ncbi:MAG: hypothetical protein LBU24_05035 [Methanocalculaceae archaeon]|jgi:Cd2+/Zn2+-exporting ATPase|nr:hypothetical protein [Methanocalculaceae archaeon]